MEHAEQDLEDIGDYIAFELKNSKSTVQMIQNLRKEMTSLVILPERHKLGEDDVLVSLGVGRCYYRDYKIYYILQKQMDTVIILHILYMFVDSRAKLYRLFGTQIE